jgi:hemolysin activation/secretion protein
VIFSQKPCRVAAALFIAALGPLQAQNFEKIGPKTVTGDGSGGRVDSAAAGVVGEPLPSNTAGEEILVKKLKAIVLQPGGAKVSEQNGASGVRFAGFFPPFILPEPEKLVNQLSQHLGQPVSIASINALSAEIVKFYRAHDRPLVDVTIPEQDITGGVLHLSLLESRLGAVRAEKNHWFRSSLLEAQVRSRPGEAIYASHILEDLQWLNNNPFRQVNAIYTPGKTFGTTDLVLETQDRFPIRFYTGYENTGTAITGSERWLAGFNWGNVLGLDQLLSYQFTTSDDFKSSLSHSFSYNIPLPWRHTLMFFGSLSQSDAPVVVNLQQFNSGGESSQASFRYTVPLPGVSWLKQDLFTGFDFKRSNNNLDFGGIRVFDKNADIFQWIAGYECQARDRLGVTTLNATGFYSPGNLDASNTDPIFTQSRAFAQANYFYSRLTLERLNRLPAEWSLDLRATAQWSDGNLLASEQLGVGGSTSVRGYDEDVARGDAGWLLSAELRTPPLKFLGRLGGRYAREDALQLLGFLDYGGARNHTLLAGEDLQQNLSSIGIGIRYSVTTYLSIRCDYGWQLLDIGAGYSSRGSVGVTLSY